MIFTKVDTLPNDTKIFTMAPFFKKSENILISWINDEKNPDSVGAAKHNDNLSFKNFVENDSLTNSR